MLVNLEADSTIALADEVGPLPCLSHGFLDGVGVEWRGEIVILGRMTQEGVAHTAANQIDWRYDLSDLVEDGESFRIGSEMLHVSTLSYCLVWQLYGK